MDQLLFSNMMSDLVALMGNETSMWNRQQMAWIEFCCHKYCDGSMDHDVLDEFVSSDFGDIVQPSKDKCICCYVKGYVVGELHCGIQSLQWCLWYNC